MTRGEEILQTVQAALDKLRATAFGPYSRVDIASVIDPLGSRLESFLRETAFPASKRQDRFVDLIKRLGDHGLEQPELQKFHAIRELYNISKHAPGTPIVLKHAVETCGHALAALRTVIELGLGTVNVPFQRELNYTLYVAFWDHYFGGETEVAIMLPSDHWLHVSSVDVFSMDFYAWDKLKLRLLAHPRFRLGKAHFAPAVWKGFLEEGELLDAGVWEGDYGELVRILADYEDRGKANALLPSLARHNNNISVGTALTLAAVDIARSSPAILDAESLVQAIISRADVEYAMQATAVRVPDAATQIAELIAALPIARWPYLAGPAIIPYKQREWSSASKGPLAVALDGNVIVLGV